MTSAAAPYPRTGFPAPALLILWFLAVLLAAASGRLASSPGSPPIPILIAVLTPIIVFLFACRTSQLFQGFVLALDLRLVTAVHA